MSPSNDTESIGLSIIIPVYDEQDSITALAQELLASIRRLRITFEILFVDDGSRDDSWQRIESLSSDEPSIGGIRLRRNFGKAAALTAGLQRARGELICTLDGDGQDDPAEIPALLEALEDADVVSSWKRPRKDPLRKRLPSWVFNKLVGKINGLKLHDHNSGLKVYRAEVFREVRIYGELYRFITVLAHARGFRVKEVPVHHRERKHGVSKYGASRFLKGIFDLLTVKLLTGYGSRPHHPLGLLGLPFLAAGLLGMGYLASTWVYRLWDPAAFAPLSQRPLLGYSVASFLFGAQIISIGFVTALIAARSAQSPEDSFSVAGSIEPSREPQRPQTEVTPGTPEDAPASAAARAISAGPIAS